MKKFLRAISLIMVFAMILAMFPACGSSNSMIELTPSELEKYSKPDGWEDICKPIG